MAELLKQPQLVICSVEFIAAREVFITPFIKQYSQAPRPSCIVGEPDLWNLNCLKILRLKSVQTLSTSERGTCSATWLQVRDILLDCRLCSPETRPIICIDECQVWNIFISGSPGFRNLNPLLSKCTSHSEIVKKDKLGLGRGLWVVRLPRGLQQLHLEMVGSCLWPKVTVKVKSTIWRS